MIASIVRLLRIASVVMCVIVIASFAVFAVDQTKGASNHQQQELSGGSSAETSGGRASSGSAPSHESGVHQAIDDASSRLTSPFSTIVSGSSEWAVRSTKLLLALLVYGFGLGFLARTIRVRV